MSVKDLALLGGAKSIPFGQLAIDRVPISVEGLEAVSSTLRSGRWSMFTSLEVSRFEAEFADYVGAQHAVLVNSCTMAIYAALRVLGVSKGDLVGAPAYTYVGTCLPIVETGAEPVWVDISSTSQNIDPEALRDVHTRSKLSAVVFPLLFGSEHDALTCAAICKSMGVPIVFDCAQYLGNQTITAKLVEFGPCCFSFGESKILRLGEGGAIVTNSLEENERLLQFRHEGEAWVGKGGSRVSLSDLSPMDVLNSLASTHNGLNLRPLAYSAALGRVKLREMESVLEATRFNAEVLTEHLSGTVGLILPVGRTVWWTFPIRVALADVSREVVLAALLAEGIPVGVHFPRLMPHHPIFNHYTLNGSIYPNAAAFSSDHLVLPIYPELGRDDMKKIAEIVNYVFSSGDLSGDRAASAAEDFLREAKLTELSSGLYMFLAEKDA